ncbi:MAG: GDP-mannose 4,6-dehydratase, partial [Candidatus Nanopelagicales bacterium]
MKILVTGGAGFIGSNFVRMALTDKFPDFKVDNLTVLDLLTYAGDKDNLILVSSDKRFKFVQGDIRDLDLVSNLMKENEY